MGESDETLAPTVTRELREIAGISARPRFAASSAGRVRWRRPPWDIPASRGIEARLAAIPGLHLAGNAYHGIGIPDCIRLGRQAATRILAG